MEKKTRRFLNLWLPPLFWAALIFLGSSLPVMKATEFYWWDFTLKKTIHLVEYFVLFTLLARAIGGGLQKKLEKNVLILSFIFLILYAALDEYHQSFTPGREPKIRDVLIDGFGGLLAIWFLKKWLPKMPAKLKNWLKG